MIKGMSVADVKSMVKNNKEQIDMNTTETAEVECRDEEEELNSKKTSMKVIEVKSPEKFLDKKIVSKHEACVAVTERSELHLRAVKSKKALMRYLIYEVYDGRYDDYENMEGLIKPSQILNGERKIRDIIQNFRADYDNQVSDIILRITNIVKRRELEPVSIDSDILPPDIIFDRLKKWFEDHMTDGRVGFFKINSNIHIALVKRGNKTPYQIFKEILSEIAPANKASTFKDYLFNNQLLIHDDNGACADTQLTLSAAIMNQLGLSGDKAISFNFDDAFKKALYETYLFEIDQLLLHPSQLDLILT